MEGLGQSPCVPSRLQNMSFVLCLMFAVTATPPGFWTLCLGGDGHSAIERALLPCSTVELRTSESDPCTPEACAGCQDFDLSTGIALREAQSLDLALVISPSSGPLPLLSPVNELNARGSLAHPPPALYQPPLETVLIRC